MQLAMLGAVVLLMRQITQPASVAFLGQVFSGPRSRQGSAVAEAKGAAARHVAADGQTSAELAVREMAPFDEKLWGPVKDNAIFLPAEQPAWFALLQRARELTPAELAQQSVASVAYAQLVNQPDAYRGRSVQVAGRILREATKPVAKNDFGITELHQLILAPRGGGQWPIVIYALDLPPGFPRGDNVGEDVVVDGLFFKNWSFPYDGGMGVAPVLVTPTLAWTQVKRDVEEATVPINVIAGAPAGSTLAVGALLACIVAIAFVLWAAAQTRRPRRPLHTPPDFDGLESES